MMGLCREGRGVILEARMLLNMRGQGDLRRAQKVVVFRAAAELSVFIEYPSWWASP